MRGMLRCLHEFLELRAPQHRTGFQLGLEQVGAPRKALGHGEADADRNVDLVGDARDEDA